MHAVIVDDDYECLFELECIMRDAGFTVNAFSDPREALNYFTNTPSDIVVSDYFMPYMNGAVLLESIMSLHHNALIIIHTSHGDDEYTKKLLLSNGAHSVLDKARMYEEKVAIFSDIFKHL